ncbi:peptidase inhibitor 16-like [Scyliorhinus canicula]|uniref:peptidase inhibitor 16-like n=1 Tax=Scyliorhinus canicula TaxID=7830 RepID=UPI0018F56DA8|nr:peptidase inhibitor 16-like [Scyliorhinus canicula]
MNLLEWDEDLEAIAQEMADRCNTSFDYRDCQSYEIWRGKVARTFELANLGQNILVYKKNLTGTALDVSSAMNKTYSMLAYYNYSNTQCTSHPALCDSVTQMVWSKTQKLGCAMGKNCTYLVCNYHPQGNEVEFLPATGWHKKQFAQPGVPCTKCDTGRGWCWDKLCVRNLTSDEGLNATCAITTCEAGGTVNGCTCQCPPHRLGNRCESPCRNAATCSGLGFSSCYNLYIFESCPLLCRRCSEKPSPDLDWWQLS